MGKIQFTDEAWDEIVKWIGEDRKKSKKIFSLLEDIRRNGYQGIGKPEPLTGNFSGYWSRRIDEKNRIIYKILDDDVVEIDQCGSHYGDK